MTLPSVTEPEKRYLTAEQVRDLAAASGEYRLVILLLAYTGLRRGEMAALRVKRLDLLKRRIFVADAVAELDDGTLAWGLPKTHERRQVPISASLADELGKHVDGMRPKDLVFTTPKGDVLRNSNARRCWFNAAVASVPDVPDDLHPHELRHTAAGHAIGSGADVKVVQRMLGHKRASMTLDVYTDLFEDNLDEVADRLDALARAAMAKSPTDQARTKSKIVDLAAYRASR